MRIAEHSNTFLVVRLARMMEKSIKSLQGANDSTVESSFREADDSNGESPTNEWGLAEMFTKMKVAMNRLRYVSDRQPPQCDRYIFIVSPK